MPPTTPPPPTPAQPPPSVPAPGPSSAPPSPHPTADLRTTHPSAKPSADDAGAAPGKAQAEFQRLTQALQALRAHLGAWQAADEAAQQRRRTELLPLLQRLRGAQRELLLWIDQHLCQPPPGERLGQGERRTLVDTLHTLAQDLLADEPDAGLLALLQRHGGSPAQARGPADRTTDRPDRHAAAHPAGDADDDRADGSDGSDGSGGSAERSADAEADFIHDHGEADRPRHPDAAERERARDAAALQQAGPSLRALYRRLAAALHPDREPDPAQRERKTALMARANRAYEAQDLMALLALQAEQQRLDAADGRAPRPGADAAQLRRYNRLLAAQQHSLQAELAALQAPVAAVLGQAGPGGLAWPPTMADAAVTTQQRALREALQALRAQLQALRDPRSRPLLLQAWQASHAQRLDADADADAHDPDARAGRGGRGRGRGRRAR